MKHITHEVDFCVVGGGIAGLCAAVSAARHGIRVALMQDRPVLGGNASSEIRMWICGANGVNDRETGIVEELFLENYYYNPNESFSIWDSVLYSKAKFEPNLTLLLNCTCQKAEMKDGAIASVTGWQLTAETYHEVKASFFADCSGDSILAPLTGADYMVGREAKAEFNETIPPDTADKKTMGMSCLIQPRETDRPQTFTPPPWANKYPTDEDLPFRGHKIGEGNYWWIELGGDRDSIHDTEEIKDELLKVAFGVWDHVKNHGDHGAENFVLDWVGFLPGKRESRRYVGNYIVNENDVLAAGPFEDVIGYGGWTMDDHEPAGFHYPQYPNVFHPAPSPWGIPFRALCSKSIPNLTFAGRNISVTHAALSSSRVMATCGVLGQALGTAVAMAVRENKPLTELDIPRLQQQLMEDDCYLPGLTRERSALTKKARSNAPEVLCGPDRQDDKNYNGYIGALNAPVVLEFDGYEQIQEIRLVFDSDLSREFDNMPCCFYLNKPYYHVPHTLVRDYKIIAHTAEGPVELVCQKDNFQRFIRHNVEVRANKIELIPQATWGDEKARIFSVDVK